MQQNLTWQAELYISNICSVNYKITQGFLRQLENLIPRVTLPIKHILGTHLFLLNILKSYGWRLLLLSFPPLLLFCSPMLSLLEEGAFSCSLQDIYYLLSHLMTPLTTPLSPLLPEMSNHSKCFRIIVVICLPGLRYGDGMDRRCKRLWGSQMSEGLHLVERKCHLKKCPSSLQL